MDSNPESPIRGHSPETPHGETAPPQASTAASPSQGTSLASRLSAALFSPWKASAPPRKNRIFPETQAQHRTQEGGNPSPHGPPTPLDHADTGDPPPAAIPVEPVPAHVRQQSLSNDKELTVVNVREDEGGLSQRSATSDEYNPSTQRSLAEESNIASQDTARRAEELKKTTEQRLAAVYAEEYRKRTALKGRDLDQWWENLGTATATANFAKVFNTSFPLSSAMEKRWFILFCVVIGAACLANTCLFLLQPSLDGITSAIMARFTVYALRSGAPAGSSSGFARNLSHVRLGLEREGCKTLLLAFGTVLEQGPDWTSLTVNLENITRFDGFYFVTHEKEPELDPSVFEFEIVEPASPGVDAGWVRVGSSRRFVPRDGSVEWLTEPMRSLPAARNVDVHITFGYPVYAWLREVASTTIVALSSALLVWLSFMGFYTWGKVVIVGTVLLTAALHFTEAVLRTLDHNYVVIPLQYVTSGGLLLFAAAGHRYEKYFMESITLAALLVLGCALLSDLHLDPDLSRLTDQVPSIFIACVGIVLLTVRWVSKRKAVRSVFQDYVMYQKVWNQLCQDPKEVLDMKRIPIILSRAPLVLSNRSIRQEMHTTLPQAYLRQKNFIKEKSTSSVTSSMRGSSLSSFIRRFSFRKLNPFARKASSFSQSDIIHRRRSGRRVSDAARYMARSLSMMMKKGGTIKLEPVTSLRLLYTQATALHPLVQEKVKDWAFHSSGRFPTREQNKGDATEFVVWKDVAGDWWKEVNIRWATLKKPQRAIEKLVRTYGGTVWQLQDLVRQSIVFEKTGELLACLELIIADKEVRVIGAKNRLQKLHDPLSTAGYRDVHLNLQLKTSLAHKLGIDNHVFEIQLQLLAYSNCKIHGGHRRYVAFRNALCM